MNFLNKLLEFLQSSSGENSSKRLVWIGSSIALIYEFFRAMNQLIESGHPSDAVDLFNYFMIFVAISGGLVTIEVVQKIIELVANIKYNKQPTNTETKL
jgi:TRAP-type C4-dicarboxylate transport system permease small subunit